MQIVDMNENKVILKIDWNMNEYKIIIKYEDVWKYQEKCKVKLWYNDV